MRSQSPSFTIQRKKQDKPIEETPGPGYYSQIQSSFKPNGPKFRKQLLPKDQDITLKPCLEIGKKIFRGTPGPNYYRPDKSKILLSSPQQTIRQRYLYGIKNITPGPNVYQTQQRSQSPEFTMKFRCQPTK